MKRNMKLVRKILLALETKYNSESFLIISGYESKIIACYCSMMFDSGLIKNFKAQAVDNNPYYVFFANGLT